MYSADAEALYEKVSAGTPVTVVDQAVKVDWIGSDLYVEASPSMAQVREWENNRRFGTSHDLGAKPLVLRKAGAAASRIDWAAYDRAIAERRGIPTRITTANAAPPPVAMAAADEPSEGFVGWLRRSLSIGGL